MSWKPQTLHNQKHGLRLKVSSEMIQKMSLYIQNQKPAWRRLKIPNHLPQKCIVPNVNVLDFVGEMFGGMMYIYIEILQR